jgi:hypothetical protein
VRNGAIFISEDADIITMSGPLNPNWSQQDKREQERIMGDGPSIERIAALVQQGIMSPREARETLERMTPPPQIINFPGETETEQAAKERILRLYAGLPIQEIIDAMAMEGYTANTLLHGRARVTIGHDPATEVAEPMVVFQAEATEDLEAGDPVVVDGDGNARRARPGENVIGVHLGDGRIRFTGGRPFAADTMEMSVARPMYHMSMAIGSMAYQGSIIGRPIGGFPRMAPRPARYQYNERFPKEVLDKAMALLARFMSAAQYEAFMGGSMIELQNKAEDHRVMLNRQGKFSILTGPRGEGIMMTSGKIGSFAYPIGDEIAVFLDWFRFRTRELIERWNCGNFSIKDYL